MIMGKIYGKTKVTPKPKKKKNEHNRLRDIIVNFRVSPKEKSVIDDVAEPVMLVLFLLGFRGDLCFSVYLSHDHSPSDSLNS